MRNHEILVLDGTCTYVTAYGISIDIVMYHCLAGSLRAAQAQLVQNYYSRTSTHQQARYSSSHWVCPVRIHGSGDVIARSSMQFMPAVLQAAAIVCGFVVGCGILWVPCPPPWASFQFFVVPILIYLGCRSNPIHLIRHYDIKESSNSNKGQYDKSWCKRWSKTWLVFKQIWRFSWSFCCRNLELPLSHC